MKDYYFILILMLCLEYENSTNFMYNSNAISFRLISEKALALTIPVKIFIFSTKSKKKEMNLINLLLCPHFEEKGVYCFALVGP
jgi:hypothetical protein